MIQIKKEVMSVGTRTIGTAGTINKIIKDLVDIRKLLLKYDKELEAARKELKWRKERMKK